MQMLHDTILQQFQQQLLEKGFQGKFITDIATLLVSATDNSIYELLPEAIIQPMDLQDVLCVISVANQSIFSHICFVARGGGTGTNGQSLTTHIIIDFSRYMNRILDFNQLQQTITVEAGLILSQLNRFLIPHGLCFAPNISTANRATIGGMIATDAAGKGSLIYGKTVDHVQNVKVVLANGVIIDTKQLSSADIAAMNLDDAMREKYQTIMQLLAEHQTEINQRFIPLKRPLSGYNIKRAYTNNTLDITSIIVGSEGTLGLVTSATLKLIPIPKYKTLVVVHYDSFIDALRDAEQLIQFKPLAIEAVDEKVQKSAQTLPNWPHLAKLLNLVDKNYISNFIEFVDNDQKILQHTIQNFIQYLESRRANYVVITNSNDINQLWSIRTLAVGLSAKAFIHKTPVAFIEDTIVPPTMLADYVADLQHLLNDYQLEYTMYGHVDVGCIHVRPALDLQNANDRDKINLITRDVMKLLKKYHGVLWGEHGKGFRGQFIPEVFGPIIYNIFCQIKTIFDPHNRFNPGKISTTTPQIALTNMATIPMRGQYDQVIPKLEQDKFRDAILCNGNAACFNQELSNIMCPSYKVTQDRIHSPKGRAMLLKQWLREKNSVNGKHREAADMVMEAMNGCLGCKGCSGQCPTKVSIPHLKTLFLEEYHKKYKSRSLSQFMEAYIEHFLLIVSKWPQIWNKLIKYKLLPTFNMIHLPTFNPMSLRRQLYQHDIVIYTNVHQVLKSEKPVVIFIDVFIGVLDTSVLLSFISVIRFLGYTPYVIYPRPSGKALINSGMVKAFKKNIKGLYNLFEPIMLHSIPIVALENSITLMFRDEVNKFGLKFSQQIKSIAEFVSSIIKLKPLLMSDSVISNLTSLPPQYTLLPHCTEQALVVQESQLWRSIFNDLHVELDIQYTGCCGMSGLYGHQKQHQEQSKDLFNMHWQPYLSNTKHILATGFSCRSQAMLQMNKKLEHPISVIESLLHKHYKPLLSTDYR